MAKSYEELLVAMKNAINSVKEDWYINPFNDKFVSYYNNYGSKKAKFIDYNYENGDKIRFIVLDPNPDKNEYIFEIKIYKNNFGIKSKKLALYNEVKNLLIDITNNSVNRPIKKVDLKIKKRLDTIKRQIKFRQSELDKMSGKEDKYDSLVNELKSYKKMAEKLEY
jgi:tetrahydromethanopterin S-methyltransferase subunit G